MLPCRLFLSAICRHVEGPDILASPFRFFRGVIVPDGCRPPSDRHGRWLHLMSRRETLELHKFISHQDVVSAKYDVNVQFTNHKM